MMRGKILVTGADGFIGSHLVECLVSEGYQVRAFVLYNSFSHWGWLETLPADLVKEIEIFPGDIRDQQMLDRAVEGMDWVFHLAALISIPYSYNTPASYLDTNVNGTLHVLQASLKNQIQRVFITSTSEVFGTAQYVPIDENHPLQGQSPYSASKIAADKLAESFYKSFDLPVTIVRPFNTYGPRQSARAVIPTIITQLLSGKKEISLGDLTPTRDFLYVKDTVAGFLDIARSDKTIGQEINIATQSDISIGQLAEMLIGLTGKQATVVSDTERKRPKDSEVMQLLGSNRKLKELTGWTPQYTLEQGLTETIAWFSQGQHIYSYKPNIYNY
jgi:dTDP-glucose 4,6-dehydratase